MLRAVQLAPPGKIRVLFLNSPLAIGADVWIQLLLLRNLPRQQLELHAAGQPPSRSSAEPAAAFAALQAIPDLALTATDFGPSMFDQSRAQKLRAMAMGALPAAASLLRLAAYIRRHRIQILHSTDRPRDAVACAALASLTGARSLIHVHVKYDTWMGRGQNWALGHADRVVGVSQFVASSLVQGGFRPERVRSVLNSIDPSAWNPALDPGPGRASLGVPASAPLIVSVARLFSWKGHRELVQALAIVQRELPDVRLAIVGADYPEGSGTTRTLRALAAELGITDNVLFTGARRDVASLLAAGDVFALPSFEEPFGLVFAEAMAMKRPVVGLTNGGTPEVVEHGKSGLLSAPKDVAGLAANLLRLLRSPELRAQMGEEGRRQVETRFHPARIASDFVNLYAELAR